MGNIGKGLSNKLQKLQNGAIKIANLSKGHFHLVSWLPYIGKQMTDCRNSKLKNNFQWVKIHSNPSFPVI